MCTNFDIRVSNSDSGGGSGQKHTPMRVVLGTAWRTMPSLSAGGVSSVITLTLSFIAAKAGL